MNLKFCFSVVFLFLFSIKGYSQCTNFHLVASDTSICTPDIIRFHVLNGIPGSSYLWDFGNSSVNGTDTIYRFFTVPQTVNVSVQITLPNGSKCTLSKNAIAIVQNNPIPKLSLSRTLLCNGPDSLTLTDNTPNSESRSWIVDAKNYGNTAKSIHHTFLSSGSKKVTMIVVDKNGCKGSKEFIDTIKVYNDNIIDFSADDVSGCVPKVVTYTLDSDPDSATYSKSYTWNFSGATNNSDVTKNPSPKYYFNKGNFDVGLQIDVSNGCVYNVNKTQYIKLGETAILDLNISSNTTCKNQKVTIHQTTKNLSGVLNWQLSGIPYSIISSSNDSIVIVPTGGGVLDIILNYNDNGCISSDTFNNFLTVNEVKADFYSTNNFHCAIPHTVNLVNTSDKMDATAISYNWEISNNNNIVYTSNDMNPQFVFNQILGYYNVKLKAIGSNGCVDSMTKADYIYQDSLKARFTINPKIFCTNQEIVINNITRPSTWQTSDLFKWYFLDSASNIVDSSQLKSPYFSSPDTGFYTVKVIGYNQIGCRDTFIVKNVIRIINPVLDFSIPNPENCIGEPMKLLGSSKPIEANFTHSWQFTHLASGTNFNAVGDNTSISPSLIGKYKAKYTHSIANGCLASDSLNSFVNGIVASINLDKSSGCAPLVVLPTAVIQEDYYGNFIGPTYQYKWTAKPSSGVVIQNENTSNPTFSFLNDDDYTINLEITNAAGCKHNSSSRVVIVGVRAGFTIADNILCLGDTLLVTDNSYNGVTNVTWEVLPTTNYTRTSQNDTLQKFHIKDSGSFQLKQIVSSNGQCFDTAYSPFRVIEVIANFDATDSILLCSPVYAEYQSSSLNADSLIWDFGDGTLFKTTSNSAGIIYSKNSGWDKGYDITLIAKNNFGCADTATKLDYLVVAGPVPSFEMSNYIGCEPLDVTFIDKSLDEDYFYFNYDDGSVLDTTKIGDVIGVKSYSIKAAETLRLAFLPSIIVYDSLGCVAVFEPTDSVIVFKTPKAITSFDNGLKGCSPFNFVFEDVSKFDDTRSWSVDGLPVSNLKKDSVLKLLAGEYSLELILVNNLGCKDTLNEIFEVLEVPSITITKQDTICLNKICEYKGEISSTIDVSNFKWNFDEVTNPDNINTTDLVVNMAYQSSGTKQISFFAELSNGCADSATLAVDITDASSIIKPTIKFVTFSENYTLDIEYEKATTPKFRSYKIDNGSTIDEIFDIDQTTISKSFNSKPLTTECYTLKVGDYCDLSSNGSTTHCFIQLSSSSLNPYEVQLDWTPYIGWDTVRDYTIYRKDDNNVFVKIGEVDGGVTQFIDLGLCDHDYEYYVQANHPTETFASKSYTVNQRPIYIKNSMQSSVNNVSVVNQNEIAVSWDLSSFSEFENFKLYKYKNDFNNLVSITSLVNNYYLDTEVETDMASYIYLVKEVDRCGYETVAEREGKSILLNGYYNDGSYLKWSNYQNWESGVNTYNLEIKKKDAYELRNSGPPSQQEFFDKNYYREIRGKYCYRIHAISNNERDTSYSNELCLNGKPIVLMPTAFSPNGDGLNDNFNPIGQFILKGELEEVNSFLFAIYNRWGEKIYETDKYEDGWDGTYKGQNCEQSTYLYTLMAIGYTGQRIFMNGSVTLVR